MALRARLYVRSLHPIHANGQSDAWQQTKCVLEAGADALIVHYKDGAIEELSAAEYNHQGAVATQMTVKPGVPARRHFVITVGEHEIAAATKAEAEGFAAALAAAGGPPEAEVAAAALQAAKQRERAVKQSKAKKMGGVTIDAPDESRGDSAAMRAALKRRESGRRIGQASARAGDDEEDDLLASLEARKARADAANLRMQPEHEEGGDMHEQAALEAKRARQKAAARAAEDDEDDLLAFLETKKGRGKTATLVKQEAETAHERAALAREKQAGHEAKESKSGTFNGGLCNWSIATPG